MCVLAAIDLGSSRMTAPLTRYHELDDRVTYIFLIQSSDRELHIFFLFKFNVKLFFFLRKKKDNRYFISIIAIP